MLKIKSSFPSTLIVAFLLLSQITFGQNATSSPYSRFGLGDLTPSGFSRNLGMGGLAFGLDQPQNINPENPAGFANTYLTTYEGGLNFVQYELKAASASQHTNTASLSYFDFAFPIKPGKCGIGFGLAPYTNVGYSLSEIVVSPFGHPELHTYKGSGGLNTFHTGIGYRISKKLAVGLTSEYLFGVINRDRTIEFGDNTTYANASFSESSSIGWFHFTGGIQLSFDSLKIAKSDSISKIDKSIKHLEDSLASTIQSNKAAGNYETINSIRQQLATEKLVREQVKFRTVKSDWKLNFGITFSPNTDLRARITNLDNNFRYYNVTSILPRDTVVNTESESGRIRLPMSVGAGFAIRKGSKWLFGSDFRVQEWEKYSYFGASDSLGNSFRTSVGIQFVPNERALKSYWKTIQYRAGFHYEKSFLKINGEQLNEIGASVGVSLPIRRAGTSMHFSAEVGKRGTTKNGLIEERYLRFTLGFTINDHWFIKTKYD